MPDNSERLDVYDRLNRHVEALLRGRRPASVGEIGRDEAEMLRIASVLNAVGVMPEPRPSFVEGLEAKLQLGTNYRACMWRQLSRRGLLRGIAAAVGLLVAGGAADRAITSRGRSAPGFGWVAVAKATELAPGSAQKFISGAVEGYLVNVDGQFRAVSALCTHMPCVLNWNGPVRQLVCPCHQAQFAVDGRHLPDGGYDEPLPSLPVFAVRQVAGMVYVFAPSRPPAPAPSEADPEDDH